MSTQRIKPVSYISHSGKKVTEQLPLYLPPWFVNAVCAWLRYKTKMGWNLYYYEMRLTTPQPTGRKFSDLWFLDHLERDHNQANPPIWHERMLATWINFLYRNDIKWFSTIDDTKLTLQESEGVYAYGIRYYPIGFSSKMRLVYHGCSMNDYFEALDQQEAMVIKERKRLEIIYKRSLKKTKPT